MTKKHFVKAARVVSLVTDPAARRVAAEMFAKIAIQLHPEFNQERFFKACNA